MEEEKKKLDGVDAYNIVSDTVGGVNVRLKDNIIQLISCGVGLIIGGVLGLIFWGGVGLLVGCILGLLAGAFLSGLYIMIYRFIMHVSGKHK
jgi:uncharacterized membrane protein